MMIDVCFEMDFEFDFTLKKKKKLAFLKKFFNQKEND